MKQNLLLTIASLLSILFMTFHLRLELIASGGSQSVDLGQG